MWDVLQLTRCFCPWYSLQQSIWDSCIGQFSSQALQTTLNSDNDFFLQQFSLRLNSNSSGSLRIKAEEKKEKNGNKLIPDKSIAVLKNLRVIMSMHHVETL